MSRVLLTLLKIGIGVAFALVWLSVSAAWAVITLPANLMANDAGTASLWDHANLMAGMALGQLVFAAAGIPGGLAISWAGLRKFWVWGFLVLALAGIAIQIWSFKSFAKAVGW